MLSVKAAWAYPSWVWYAEVDSWKERSAETNFYFEVLELLVALFVDRGLCVEVVCHLLLPLPEVCKGCANPHGCVLGLRVELVVHDIGPVK